MGSSTLVLSREHSVKELKSKDSFSQRDSSSGECIGDENSKDPYEQVRPKNEHLYMNYLRALEKKIGLKTPVIYLNALTISLLHIYTVYQIYLYLTDKSWQPLKWQSWIFGFVMGAVSGVGVTAGVHRLWSHRSYAAAPPLQVLLLACFSVSGQNTVYDWVRDHRVHHKFSETAADPHDANRGFFFSHVGWLMMRKHPEVIRRGNQIDMSDIALDPLISFHNRYFVFLKILLCFVIPTAIPVLLWDESWWNAFASQCLVRYVLTLNFTWSVNSVAHLYGSKPYDKSIMPVENWAVAAVAMGEGWHNYHHTFPWDYKASELPYTLNCTTIFLDACSKIGWVLDRREASPDLIRAVMKKKGQLSD